MRLGAVVLVMALAVCSSAVIGRSLSALSGRSLLAECPHATSGLWNCAPMAGNATENSTGLVVCLNICPSSADPCGPCSNPAIACSSVEANRTMMAPKEFNATLREYQYGNVCFSPTPPPGAIGAEDSNPGLPSVSEPDGGGPTPSYTGKAPGGPPGGR